MLKIKNNWDMRRWIVFLALGLSFPVFSQSLERASAKYPELRFYPLRGEVFYSDYQRVKGTAYLTSDWVMGVVTLTGGDKIREVKLKVDIFEHHLLAYNDYLKRTIKIDTREVERFSITDGNKTRVFQKVNNDFGFKKNDNVYFMEVLQEGKLSFYKLIQKSMLPMATPQSGYSDEFYTSEHYYLFYRGRFEQIRLRRSELTSRFPELKADIKSFARQQKLRMKKEEDFAKVVEYIGSVLK
jgi:hypothetical protein